MSLLGCQLYGHGELDKRIKEISIQILNDPTNSSLFLKRGTLYYQHEEYQRSIEDYRICIGRNFISDQLYLAIAHSFLKAQELDSSMLYSHKILSHTPNHVLALKAKATALYEKEAYKESAQNFLAVIDNVDIPTSDNYFESVKAFESCGSKECIDSAIETLQDGLETLGELSVFQQKLVELYQLSGQFDKALYIQDIIISKSHRKERPLFKKALILQDHGELELAFQEFNKALSSLEKLPKRINQNKASQRLRKEILAQIDKIEKLE